jgi:hypothetical protein
MNECLRRWIAAVVVLMSVAAGCSRLPYTTKPVHEDFRVAVNVQKEVTPARYSHPVQLTADQVAAILRNFSLREEQSLPLRWFAEEAPPKPVFREEELVWVSPYLVEALQKAGPEERAHFQLFSPGMNRAQTRNVTAGWVAVREPFLYLTIEYFHTEIPARHSDPYYPNNPAMPPQPKTYLLFFEPGRFLVTDESGARALQFHDYLKATQVSPLNP